MITLKTDCKNCAHAMMCKWKDNAKFAMERLKNMQYGDGPNDDYDWDTIMRSKNVNIEFSCPDYTSSSPINYLNRDHGFDVR